MDSFLESTVNQRFNFLLDFKKIEQKKFSELSGMSQATVSNILNGVTKDPKADFFQSIARIWPEVNLRWLLLGEKPIFIEFNPVLMVNETEQAPVYESADEKKQLLNMLQNQQETLANISRMINEIPALRLEIDELKRRLNEYEIKLLGR